MPPTPPPYADGPEVGLLDGLATARAIRRFRPEPVPDADLARMLFGATRAPSGSNRQPARFLVLRQGPRATQARNVLGRRFREQWATEQPRIYGYASNPPGSRAARMGEVMQGFVDGLEQVPVIILVCSELEEGHQWGPRDGGSVYPAVQNLLLAARALGYGGVISHWHRFVADELRTILEIPPEVFIFVTVAIGRPVGGHGPVRRLPLADVVFEDGWRQPAAWAVDPPGTRFSGPPTPAFLPDPGSG
ncbi:MAG TPA: nitroreductase family protein [Acidimicrobiales bacterium]|nr:nitroreductase family protein [Acidimicrobiales bacterium]